jgi:hypothetical protein
MNEEPIIGERVMTPEEKEAVDQIQSMPRSERRRLAKRSGVHPSSIRGTTQPLRKHVRRQWA